MSTEDVAMRLVELCKGSEWKKAVDDLYAKDIVSVEPRQVANMPAEMRGIDQVRGKNDWWENNMEVHDSKVSGPFVAGDTFVVRFDIDATDKNSKKRMQMSEVGIYTVKNDKIAHERFLPLAEE
ncbi:MAG: nuclear transport factor 2 family protein [Verrucomicrobia bacterium]|jgi:SnoaL-like domain|nr:MAG: nuclear transport factor 2 family protein [Verrucomicrobiota bacterium]PYL92043.1 MAG: nuclear transport factor 2 family protein [Verrucomicrobiota bacterium]TMP91309.1 MAG: nuclear transport factor 2 family protein [Verrucomicrobiota bacterium]